MAIRWCLASVQDWPTSAPHPYYPLSWEVITRTHGEKKEKKVGGWAAPTSGAARKQGVRRCARMLAHPQIRNDVGLSMSDIHQPSPLHAQSYVPISDLARPPQARRFWESTTAAARAHKSSRVCRSFHGGNRSLAASRYSRADRTSSQPQLTLWCIAGSMGNGTLMSLGPEDAEKVKNLILKARCYLCV
jgi:hypothetical protein